MNEREHTPARPPAHTAARPPARTAAHPAAAAGDAAPERLPVSRALYLALAAASVGLPTGSVLGVNVKWALLGLTGAALLAEAGLRLSPRQLRVAAAAAVAAWVSLLFATWSLLRGNAPGPLLEQLKEFLAVAFVLALGLVLFRPGREDAARLTDTLVAAAGIFSAAKLAAAAAVLAGAIPFSTVVAFTLAVFGQTAAGLAFEGSLVRIQLGNDFAMPYLLYFGLAHGRRGGALRRLALLAIGLGVVVSMSRFLWFALAVAFAALWLRSAPTRLLAPTAAVAAVAAAAWLAATATELGRTTVEARFESTASTEGDVVRVEQSQVLLDEFKKRPLLGRGLGTHSDRLVRSEEAPWSYENQWLALLMQLGVVGLLAVLALPAALARGLLRRRPRALGLADLAVLAVFLLAAFFNPALTSSTSGAVLLLFGLVAFAPPPADAAPAAGAAEESAA